MFLEGGCLHSALLPLTKGEKEAVQDICPLFFLILNISVNSPGSPAPKPAGRKNLKNTVHLPVNPEKHIPTSKVT